MSCGSLLLSLVLVGAHPVPFETRAFLAFAKLSCRILHSTGISQGGAGSTLQEERYGHDHFLCS